MQINTKVLVPFGDIMTCIEDFLIEHEFVKKDEYMVYADLGIDVNEDGFVEVEVEIQDQLEFHNLLESEPFDE